jgi:hypothetical protein
VAGLFGATPKAGTIKELDHVTIGTSSFGKPVPIVYGTTRIAGNVLWMPKELWLKVPGQAAGKGGVDEGSPDTYYQGVAIGICEGPVSLGRVWRDKELFATLADVEKGAPFTFLSGTRTQSPWSGFGASGTTAFGQFQGPISGGLTVTLPAATTTVGSVQVRDADSTWFRSNRVAPGTESGFDHSISGNVVTFGGGAAGFTARISYITSTTNAGWVIGYGGTALVATPKLNLGSSNTLKNLSWEVNGFVGSGNVNPADIVADFLTNAEYGAGWPASLLEVVNGQDGTAASGYQRYCARWDSCSRPRSRSSGRRSSTCSGSSTRATPAFSRPATARSASSRSGTPRSEPTPPTRRPRTR